MRSIEELYMQPIDVPFTLEELIKIKKHIPIDNFICRYAVYKPISGKNIYIGFFIDSAPNSVRRSGVINHWDFVSTRKITEIEYNEYIKNFGLNNRRFLMWKYRFIEDLIKEDLDFYSVVTPFKFVEKCKRLGYSKKSS